MLLRTKPTIEQTLEFPKHHIQKWDISDRALYCYFLISTSKNTYHYRTELGTRFFKLVSDRTEINISEYILKLCS